MKHGARVLFGAAKSRIAAALVGLGLLVGPTFAASRTYRIFQAPVAPRIDGKLKDVCWRSVPWGTGFVKLGGGKPEAQTQFAMAWRGSWLYVAVNVLEPRIENVRSGSGRGNMGLFNDDHIEVFLGDPKLQKHCYQMGVDPEGNRIDIAWNDKNRVGYQQVDRSGDWHVECRSAGLRWRVEMAIPLNRLNLKAKEGESVLGNVCRTRTTTGRRLHSSWSPVKKQFHEYEAFGKLVFAGLPGPAEAAKSLAEKEDLDTVLTRDGDRLTGKVVAVNEKGLLSLQGRQFSGPVRLRTAALQRTDFGKSPVDLEGCLVSLTSGDRFTGRLVGLTDESLCLAGGLLGEVNVPRQAVGRIILGAGNVPEVESRFEEGDLAPWRSRGGGWSLDSRGLAFAGNPSSRSVLYLKQEKADAVTVTVDFEPITRSNVHCQIMLAADNPSTRNMKNGIVLQMYTGGYHLYLRQNRRHHQITQPQSYQGAGTSPLRIAYDSSARKLLLWFNKKKAGEFEAIPGPIQGDYIVLMPQHPIRFRRITVTRGVVSPETEAEMTDDGSTKVLLANQDEVTGKSVTLKDGQFVVQSEYGKLRMPTDRVASLRFSKPGDKPQPLGGGVVRVYTKKGRLTMKLNEVTAEHVVGLTRQFGSVRVRRDAVRYILFRAPKAEARIPDQVRQPPVPRHRIVHDIGPEVLFNLPARILEQIIVHDRKR